MVKSLSVLLAALLCSVALLGCRTEPAPPISLNLDQPDLAGDSEHLGEGLHQRTLASAEGPPVRYTINIPRGYDSSKPLPLVVALPFGGEAKPFHGKEIITELCRPAFLFWPAILVAPDGLSGDWKSEENEQIVLSIYEHITKHYNIDKNRTLLTGFSSGGDGTWYIAGRHQDVFKAAIPITSQPDQSISDWNIPVYAIHSQSDDIVPIGPTKEYVKEMRKNGAKMRLMTTPNFPHNRTKLYAQPLRDTLNWLESIWSETSSHP